MKFQARTGALGTQPASSYLPGLDGLRALAVLAVFVYHANATWLPGGFLGVEIFFVISGFIITRGLTTEWQKTGRIALLTFWKRRALRLLPALFLLLIGVLAYAALFDSNTLAKLREDVLFALAYVTNWHLIFSNQSYFDSWNQPSVLRHLWSLAIEEQFYLLWPVLLAGALRFLKAKAAWAVILIGAVASYTAMALLASDDPARDMSRVYYGTDTRVGALLVGAAVGFLPLAPRLMSWVTGSRLLSMAGIIALGQLILFLFVYQDTSVFIYRGGFLLATLMTAVLILSLNSPASLGSRLLGLKPLRWIGVRSYGIYLYHWPILLLTWPDITGSIPTLLLQGAATLVLAGLSYSLIEQPIRKGLLGRTYRALTEQRAGWRQSFAAGFSVAAVAVIVGSLTVVAMKAEQPVVPSYLAVGQIRIVSPSQGQDVSSQMETINPTATPTAEPSEPGPESQEEPPPPEATATPEHTDAPPANTGQDRCAEIRGRTYESEEERAWFLDNCVQQQPPPQQQQPPPSQSLPTHVATGSITVPGGISAVGDSVMVGAGGWLAANFANIDVDAAVGRQVANAIALLSQRVAQGNLGNTVVLHLGNNGTFTSGQFDQIMQVLGPERRVFFMNLRVPRNWEEGNNAVIASGVSRYANAYLIDWHGVVQGQEHIFAADGVHIGPSGASIYTGLVIGAVGY